VVRVDRLDSRGHLGDPGAAGSGAARPSEEVGFVAEVPHPDGRMLAVRADDAIEQEPLRRECDGVVEGIAVPALDRAAAAHHLPHRRRWRGRNVVEEPPRCPVRPAHVTGEEGDVEPERVPRGEVGDLAEVLQAVRRDGTRGRLPVVPEEEQPHDVHAEGRYEGEVLVDLAGVEVRPPPHRRATGPVVHAEDEACGVRRISLRRHDPTPLTTTESGWRVRVEEDALPSLGMDV
jgi:hypothetical protein